MCLFFWQPQCWSQSVFGWNDFIVLSWNQGNFSLQTQKVEGSLLEGTGNMLEQRRWLERSSEGAAFMYITSQYLQRGAASGGSCIGIYYIIILSKYVVLLTYTQYIVQILYTYTCTCSHCLMLRPVSDWRCMSKLLKNSLSPELAFRWIAFFVPRQSSKKLVLQCDLEQTYEVEWYCYH